MSSSAKWAIALGGLILVFLSGPFSSLLGVLWLIGVLVMIASSPPKTPATSVPLNTASTDPSKDYIDQLDAAIQNEQNPDTRRGLEQAKAMAVASLGQSASITSASAATVVQPMPAGIPIAEVKSTQQLDQTVALLYVGAFLFLGGMGLFIAYGELSNTTRLVLIAVLAAVLYAGGLVLFQKKTSLRPAAVTFLAIGLFLIPLVGYASVKLTSVDASVAWFMTSVIGLSAYVYALLRSRLELVGYLVFLMWISLAESSLSFFDASVIWSIWAALAIGSISLLFVPRLSAYDRNLGHAFWWSSIILAPLALVATLLYVVGGTLDVWQFGVTSLLAGVFSLACMRVASYAADSSLSKADYAVTAHVLITIGSLTITYDEIGSGLGFIAVLLMTAIIHVIAWLGLSARISWLSYDRFLYVFGPLLSIVAWYFALSDATWLTVAIGVTAFISSCLAIVYLRLSSLLIALISGLLLPLALVRAMDLYEGDEFSVTSSLYALIFFVYATVRYLGRNNPMLRIIMPIAYGAGLAAAWITAMLSGVFTVQLLMSALALIAVVQASFAERKPALFVLVGPLLFTISYLMLHHYIGEGYWAETIVYAGLIVAAVNYLISLLVDVSRAKYGLFSAVSSLAIAWCVTLTLSDAPWTYLGPLILLALASLTLYEKDRFGGKVYFALLPIALVFVALNEFLVRADVTDNWLVYTHLWSVYAVVVTYYLKRNHATKSNLDVAKFGALALFTIPVALQSLVSGGEYDILLLCEQAALLIISVATGRKYLTAWAAVVITLVILYSLRSFGYLQLVIIAVSFIGYALYRLKQRQ